MTVPSNDLSSPWFFLSYARRVTRDDSAPNPEVIRLFNTLEAELAEMSANGPGFEYGFMDTTMTGAEDWERHVLNAAGTCQVLIALLSEKYLTASKWCAREWDLVSRRPVKPLRGMRRPVPGAILPVLWAPIKVPIPKAVKTIQRFIPDIDNPAIMSRYESEGLLGVMRANEQEYRWVVWKLAMRVRHMVASRSVEELILADTIGLAETFEEMGG